MKLVIVVWLRCSYFVLSSEHVSMPLFRWLLSGATLNVSSNLTTILADNVCKENVSFPIHSFLHHSVIRVPNGSLWLQSKKSVKLWQELACTHIRALLRFDMVLYTTSGYTRRVPCEASLGWITNKLQYFRLVSINVIQYSARIQTSLNMCTLMVTS